MKDGGCLLIDEISLAEDAVLERLNSVLEPARKLLLSERSRRGEGEGEGEEREEYEVTAAEGFVFMATMNPGGDYGKKEVLLQHCIINKLSMHKLPGCSFFLLGKHL